MRSAKDPQFVLNEAGQVVALYMGGDYCSEHECGIKGIQRAFGITQDGPSGLRFGLERRQIRQVPRDFGLLARKYDLVLHYGVYDPQWLMDEKQPYSELDYPITGWKPKLTKKGKPFKSGRTDAVRGDCAAAWSDRDFAFATRGVENTTKLREVHKAILDLDAVIMIGGKEANNPFGCAGLVIGILSRVPEESAKVMLDADTERHKLDLDMKHEAGTLFEDLKAAGKGWYALGNPNRRFDDGQLRLWLNPQEQGRYDCGWFTIEELRQWQRGEGPVMKAGKT